MIPVKSVGEIGVMREACAIAANVLELLCRAVEVGVNTYDLDQEGKRLIASYGAKSACFQYRAGSRVFPSHTCLSVNDVIVHGIGSLNTVLKQGDIITVDVCVEYKGFIGDNARTIAVGEIPDTTRQLLEATQEALFLGISEARAGNRVGFISNAVESFIRPKGYGIVRDFVGHGVGRSMHEEPQIPNFGPRKSGAKLRAGMTLAIEPMIALGRHQVEILPDGWTARMKDRSLSAHFEHTVLVTNGEPEILTVPTV
ncbi:MAG: type I methionyl aminopeptidase [Verrucomicrobia bacterium]|nr:type I methionyl aminopeptidase [Verrucomicrobiota bacterium]